MTTTVAKKKKTKGSAKKGANQEVRKFENKYGYFTADGREYVITRPDTPRPWVNVICNGEYGMIETQTGSGFSWLGNSNLARITRWDQDLIRDNWGTDIVPELKPKADDVVLYKHRFSGFYQTELDATLKTLGAKHLIITGCTTSVCVESTIRDAMFRDYLPVLLADCTGEPIGYSFPRSNHEASLLVIKTLLGWVSGSEEFMKALKEV